MLTLHMVQELKVALALFCILHEAFNLLHRRVFVLSFLFDAQLLFVDFALHNGVICIHPNCKRCDNFVLLTKAYANPITSKVSSKWI